MAEKTNKKKSSEATSEPTADAISRTINEGMKAELETLRAENERLLARVAELEQS